MVAHQLIRKAVTENAMPSIPMPAGNLSGKKPALFKTADFSTSRVLKGPAPPAMNHLITTGTQTNIQATGMDKKPKSKPLKTELRVKKPVCRPQQKSAEKGRKPNSKAHSTASHKGHGVPARKGPTCPNPGSHNEETY